nr:hypothetical protein [Pseudomonas sp. P818]
MHFNVQPLDALTMVLDPLLAVGFLVAAYLFQSASRASGNKAYGKLSTGCRFMFLAYVSPFIFLFFGDIIHGEKLIDYLAYYSSLPYSLSLAGGLLFTLSAAHQLKAQQKQINKKLSSA